MYQVISMIIKPTSVKKIKVMKMTFRCGDSVAQSFHEKDGEKVAEKVGYAPQFFPNGDKNFGVFIELDIDLTTGQILNWVPPTEAQMREALKEDEI
jgi:hypothetical protein